MTLLQRPKCRCEDQAVLDGVSTLEIAHWPTVKRCPWFAQSRHKLSPRRIECDNHIFESEPQVSEWKPGFVDTFLRRKQQTIPKHRRPRVDVQPIELCAKRHSLEDASRKSRVRLRVDAERSDMSAVCDSGGAVACTMGDAPDNSVRPEWLSLGTAGDGDYLLPQRSKRAPSATATDAKFPAAVRTSISK